jgi:hypothetical protein
MKVDTFVRWLNARLASEHAVDGIEDSDLVDGVQCSCTFDINADADGDGGAFREIGDRDGGASPIKSGTGGDSESWRPGPGPGCPQPEAAQAQPRQLGLVPTGLNLASPECTDVTLRLHCRSALEMANRAARRP